jgi:serralysin
MSKRAFALCLTLMLVVPHLTMVAHGQTTAGFTLQRWATQQGNLIDGMLWFVGDFNGDGKEDLATVWNDAGQISMDVQASTGTAFTLQRWATKQGNLIDGMLWFVGDLNGDGRDDLATLWNDAGQISMDVHASTGTAFTLQRWATQQGNLIDGMLWFVGDFDGDGRHDLATVWNDVGKITIDVHASTGTAFALQRWATQQGDLIAGMLWFVGDFNGDGKQDLATVWNDAGQISMDVHASTGTAFTLQRWATKQGDLIDGMLWFVGDFDGDSRDDLAVMWNDVGKITIDVHGSTGTAFTLQRWATQQGNLIDGMLWFVGDFNGDGRDDLAVRWNDAGKISIDVHASRRTAFTLQRWATQQGDLIDDMLWFVGDFNGDGKDDLADRWNDVGKITIDAFVAHVTYFVYLPVVMK